MADYKLQITNWFDVVSSETLSSKKLRVLCEILCASLREKKMIKRLTDYKLQIHYVAAFGGGLMLFHPKFYRKKPS